MSSPTDISISLKTHIIIWTFSILTVGTSVLLIILSNPQNGTLPYLTPLALSLQAQYRKKPIFSPLRALDVVNPHLAPLYLLAFFACRRTQKGWLGGWVFLAWNVVFRLHAWVTDLVLLCGVGEERWRSAGGWVWWVGKGTGRGAGAVVVGWVVVLGVCGAEVMGWRVLEPEWWEVTKKRQGDVEAAERGEKEKGVEVAKGGEKKVRFQEL